MGEHQIGFGVLGPLQMTVDGAPVALGTPKQRAVLAMLVMNRNRPVSTDSLITAAWEQSPPTEARASLHSYVSNLRKLLSGAGADPKSALVNAPPGYRLEVGDGKCDLGRFVAQKAAGVQAAAAGRFEEASRHLCNALGEWRGSVLEDLRDFGFVDAYATALTEDKVMTHTAHAEAEIVCGRADYAISELEGLTVEHPYREPLWAQLITAYYQAERQSDALEAYQRLKTTLADDLGIDPGPTVRALHERILRQQPLDVRKTARTTAVHTIGAIEARTAIGPSPTVAALHSSDGHIHPLTATATRIGRLTDNDVVLTGGGVSRHHAVIIDTGTSFVITDLRSANGVDVRGQRIRGTAILGDGDPIRICDHELTFRIDPHPA
ncbi:regulator [Mycolicibacterium sp. GF69]|uniref:BTAD domain-containing putative transcriptional regulator n=1 Tax=Mycolicibacterium sp. GF69 TaxID=2267251 RepID=UPI000DCBCFEA|nr:BTAD domain-containing putative transcriptional regulator [Mycolicibacterium sp. GF69]RAV13932.1 regulator [Mycolicibacterium sp. GF69]